jgi:hypothetical protein
MDEALWPVPIQNYFSNYKRVQTFERAPWTTDQPVTRPLPHRTAQHRKTRTDIHALSGIGTHGPIIKDVNFHALDRAATEYLDLYA